MEWPNRVLPDGVDRLVKVLVTGGSGFIGSYFYDVLVGGGHDVGILDLVEPGYDAREATYVRGDIRDEEALDRAMDGCDAVCHLAAAHHDFGIAHDTYFSVNEHGSQVVCDAMDRAGIRDVCFYSTVAVYGDAPEPHHEDSEKKPNSPYGASKLAGEGVFRRWTELGDGRRCLVIRPTVTFGERNFANMYTLIRQVHTGKFLPVGEGRNIKSLSYVENIVDATMHLWFGAARIPAGFDVFNFIDKPDLTSKQITEIVYDALGKKSPSMAIPLGLALFLALPFDAVIALTGKNLPVSSARIRKLATVQTKFEADKILATGFTPRHSLEEGIRKMVAWYLREGKDIKPVWHTPPAEPVMIGVPAPA